MQNIWKVFKNKPLALLLFLGLLASSCTSVYYEKPVPQKGAELRSFPTDWPGTYLSEPAKKEDLSELEQIFQQCFRMDRLSDRKLLVSTEYRIHEKHIPRLITALEEEKTEGRMVEYQLSESALLYTINSGGGTEQQYTAFMKSGPWYILTQTMAPFRQFDLDKGIQIEFEDKNKGKIEEWLPEADSITSKISSLVARNKEQAWYFNTRLEDETKWSLLYVEQTGRDKLTVKFSNLEDKDDFEKRQDYFNAITTFKKVENSRYEIDPNDRALDRLMAEPGLFLTYYLTRIE